eukprot:1181579-Prorocentrum_minimum.AAC.1
MSRAEAHFRCLRLTQPPRAPLPFLSEPGGCPVPKVPPGPRLQSAARLRAPRGGGGGGPARAPPRAPYSEGDLAEEIAVEGSARQLADGGHEQAQRVQLLRPRAPLPRPGPVPGGAGAAADPVGAAGGAQKGGHGALPVPAARRLPGLHPHQRPFQWQPLLANSPATALRNSYI